MKIFRNIFLLLVGLFLSQAVAAQAVLTGTVKDKTTGEAVVGANVYFVNSSNRTLTGGIVDATGQYRVTVPSETEGVSVVFSFVGYKTQTITYTSQRSLHMILEEEGRDMGGIQVVATATPRNDVGITQREVTGATEKITLERLETAPVTSVVEALQGSMSNVDIVTSADPGGKATIRMRGITSLTTGSDPLIVLDGVPFPVDIASDFSFATANSDDFGQLLNISPSDLESIEALKDAAATALWGSRGANGVLLITTKKGQPRTPLSVSFSTMFEFNKEASTIPLLNGTQYVSMIQDAIWNTVNTLGYGASLQYTKMLFDTKEIGYFPEWEYFDEYNQSTNWVDEIVQTGYKTDNNLSISGGGEKTTYRLSLGFVDQRGTVIGTGMQRFSTSFNMRYNFSDKFFITTDFRFDRTDVDSNFEDKVGGKDVPEARFSAINKMPNQTPYSIDENGNRTGDYFTPYSNFQGSWIDGQIINPVALVNESVKNSMKNTSRVVFNAEYRFNSEFRYKGTLGLDVGTTKTIGYLPQSVTGVTWVDPAFNASFDNISESFTLNTQNQLFYTKNFTENHKLIASGTLRTYDTKGSSYSSSVSGNASTYMIDPVSGGKIVSMGSGRNQSRNINFNLNANYTFYKNYIFNATYNVEGSSAMGKENRFGGFPTVSFAWQLGDEKFMEWAREKSLNEAKLRMSWGQVGKSMGGTGKYFGTFNSMTTSYIDMPAIAPTSIQLDNIDWEIVTQSDIGLDLSFMDNRLKTTFELYNKVTTQMLDKIKIPTTTGYSEVAGYNSGKMTNRGWEFMMSYDVIRKKDLTFTVNFNISQNQNEINELPINQVEGDSKYTFNNGTYATKIVVNNPLGSFYGYKYLGVYQNREETYLRDESGSVVRDLSGVPVVMRNGSSTVYPGDAKYQDTNGDGTIDQYDIVYLGNSNPTATGGLYFRLNYKDWGLSVQFHGRFGQKAVNQARMNMESMRGKGNQSTAVLRRWRNEGDQTEIPRALYNTGYNYLGSDRFVEDASFLRLKSLSLSYKLPRKLLERYKMNQLQVYVTAYDLWTITDYTGQDPEVSVSGNVAYDRAMTPKPIRLAAGLNLKF